MPVCVCLAACGMRQVGAFATFYGMYVGLLGYQLSVLALTMLFSGALLHTAQRDLVLTSASIVWYIYDSA